MNHKILVTGGAGYLGSILVPELLMEGYEVTVVDNFMFNQSSLNQLYSYDKFKIINQDVRIKSSMEAIYSKYDIILPLASLVGAPLCKKDPIGSSTTNHDSIMDMLKILSKNQLVIMPTTNSAYGTGDKDNLCDENSPLNPISSYAVDKVKIENELMKREKYISFRLATVFGFSPRMRLDLLVNDFVYRAYRDKYIVLFESKFKRNYIHIKDVSRAFIHGIKNFDKMQSNTYNVGLSDANISKFELCEKIKKFVPDFVIFEEQFAKDEDQRNYIVSNKKIENTGFKPKFSLEDGIKELLKGYVTIKNNIHGNV
jgi:nucleoside-diphosphate-sugar epimerase